MKRFIKRLKAAWYAFNLQPAEIEIQDYHITSPVVPGDRCNAWTIIGNYDKCDNEAKNCFSRSFLIIKFEYDSDHAHLCEKHGKELMQTGTVTL